jgi:outer membrane protein assembly factor BamB
LKRLQTLILSKLSDTRTQFDRHLCQSKGALGKNVIIFAAVTPIRVSQALTYVLICITAASAAYWLMYILQIPSPADSVLKNFKGTALYTNQDINTSYPLFGSKTIAKDIIILRGVVVTDKNKDGIYQGFALFDIDGKPTGAIAVGEMMGRGLALQAIDPETATLLYQGKEMHFSIQKTKKEKIPLSRDLEMNQSRN